jgi:uncharacterized protein
MAHPKNQKSCPICGKATEERFKPFCSKRCAHVDLHRWLSGSYAIAGTEEEEEDGVRAEDSGTLH